MMRIQAIDFARGINMVLMVLFNWSVTLGFFNIILAPSSFLYWFVLPRIIASVFIFVSGTAAYASYGSKKKGFRKRYFVRGLKMLFFATLITIFTYVFVPQGTVLFGILHFFAVSSFIVPFFINRRKLSLVAGMSIILLGILLQGMQFDFNYLLWLGLAPKGFFTFDYFPLVPWLGVMMLGMYFGKGIAAKASKFKKLEGVLPKIFTFLGRNSMTVYLVHQPVLVAILLLLGFKLVL